MGVAAVVHLKVFPAKPYQQGERCIRNVAVMSDYASLGAPPDPEEVRESGRLTKMHLVQPDDRERRLSFPQSVRDVVLGSGEIVCFPMCLSSFFWVLLHTPHVSQKNLNFHLHTSKSASFLRKYSLS